MRKVILWILAGILSLFLVLAGIYFAIGHRGFSGRNPPLSEAKIEKYTESAIRGDVLSARALFKHYIVHTSDIREAKRWHDFGLKRGDRWATQKFNDYLEEIVQKFERLEQGFGKQPPVSSESAELLNASMQSGFGPPLYHAIEDDRADVIADLIRYGALLNPVEWYDFAPLNWAAFFGRPKAVEQLLEAGANPKRPVGWSIQSETPLHIVASGSLADMESPKDSTPQNRLKIAEKLIAAGVDVNCITTLGYFEGWTPLMGASASGHLELTKLLLEKGAKVNAVSPGGPWAGYSALHKACQGGHLEVVKLLLENGADVNARSGESEYEMYSLKSPLDLAKGEDLRNYLIQHGGKAGSQFEKTP